MSTTLTGKNQITVPAAIIREMKLEPGAQFEWTVGPEPGMITLKVLPSIRERLRSIQEWGAKIKAEMPPGWDPIAELIAERELDMQIEEQEIAEFHERIRQREAAAAREADRANDDAPVTGS